MAKCGAKTKSKGTPCQRDAMANGRCMIHGGKTPETNQNAVKHGFYSKCYTEDEKNDLDSIEIGTLAAELRLAKTQLRRAASVKEYDKNYRPDVIERLLNTVGRLEKQHAEITMDKGTDELDWGAIARIGVALTEEVDSIKISRRATSTNN